MSANGGYRYILEAVDPGSDGLRFYLGVGTHRVGRGEVDVSIPLDGISREHCTLDVLPDGGVVVRDLDSTNGTRVDGRRITACAVHQPLQLSFGDHPFRLLPESADGLALLTTGHSAALPTASTATVAPTLRPDRDADLWEAAFEGAVAADSSFPVMVWLARLRDATQASALELRRRADASIAAAVGRSTETLRELASTEHWSLHGDLVDPPTATLIRMLGLVPDVDRGEAEQAAGPSSADSGTVQPELRRQLADARRVAQGGLSLLIRGESGTGKEWTARWLHDQSPRAAGPFYALNCAAIPDDLLEAELFGIEAGVATGVEARSGVFARAEGGTLFLDEIGEMAPALQAKLLRALDAGEIVPVGARSARTVDVRVLSATNRDLEQAMRDGDFRNDLFYRLAAHVLMLPPLRERREDIPALVSAFFHAACRSTDRSSPGITTRAMQALVDHDWPGNVRQLRFTIERAVQLLDPGRPLDLPQLPDGLAGNDDTASAFLLRARVARAEAEALRMALEATQGEITSACRLLGIGRSTFYDKARALSVALPGAEGNE